MENLYLGIELGSTRIKCSLIDEAGTPIARGIYGWENVLNQGFWSYDLNAAMLGIGKCYLDMKHQYETKTKRKLTTIRGIGISAMMHGFIALDKENHLLTPFRTWRNNHTEDCAKELSTILNFHIPARWSIAHLYYALKKEEDFALKIDHMETLASFVHYQLTGKRAIGVNDASGIFPLDEQANYHQEYLHTTQLLLQKYQFSKPLETVFPPIISVGEQTGRLTLQGAKILDPEGDLEPGSILCPPEGDAGTGMISTNTVRPGTANISCGTSIFGSFVLPFPLHKGYPEIDMVHTPDGHPVAMIHGNNCTSAIDACYHVVQDILKTFGVVKAPDTIYEILFKTAMQSKADFKDMVLYNYLSGENITQVKEGALLLAKKGTNLLDISSIMLSAIFSSFVTFSIGMDVLQKEKVTMKEVYAHGGIFETKGCAQEILASILKQEVSVIKEISEGGAWGMAILALYTHYKEKFSLHAFLDQIVFKNKEKNRAYPNSALTQQFQTYKENVISCLEAERIIGRELMKE